MQSHERDCCKWPLDAKRLSHRQLQSGSQRTQKGTLRVDVVTASILGSARGGSPGDFAALGGTCRSKESVSDSMKKSKQPSQGEMPDQQRALGYRDIVRRQAAYVLAISDINKPDLSAGHDVAYGSRMQVCAKSF